MVFANLHNHSEFSFFGSLIRIEDLAKFSGSGGFPACCLTDTCSTYGFYRLGRLCSFYGIKPVYGIELFVRGLRGKGHYSMRFIAQNRKGLENLFALNSASWARHAENNYFALDYDTVASHSEGLVALADSEFYSCRSDPVHQEKLAGRLRDIFGERCYVEINYSGPASVEGVKGLISIAERIGLPCVATGAARYFPAERESFGLLNRLREKTYKDERGLPLDPDSDHSVRTMLKFRHVFQNHPDYMDRASSIIESIEPHPDSRVFHFPKLSRKPGKLETLCADTLRKFGLDRDKYRRRLDHELKIVTSLGIEDYFLAVSDLARYLARQKIPRSTASNSAASSLILYLLGWTSTDPVLYDLPFEAFVCERRDQVPMLAAGLDKEGQKEAVKRLIEKFGARNVASAAAPGAYKPRQMIRDFGRIRQVPSKKLDEIMENIPYNSTETLKELTRGGSKLAELYHRDEELRDFFNSLFPIEGLALIPTAHTYGPKTVVLFDKGAQNFASVESVKDGLGTAQFAPADLEDAGLIRFSFHSDREALILRDVMHLASLRTVDRSGREVYESLAEGDVTCIPRLDNSPAREALRKSRPDSITALADVLVQSRPAFLRSGLALQYAQRRNGADAPELLPQISSAAGDTYGVFLYREQFLKFAVETAGFEWHEARRFEDAVRQKNTAEAGTFREKFVGGCERTGMSPADADAQFVSFVEFGWILQSRADTIALAELTYDAAFLKLSRPLEFYLALLNNRIDSGSGLNVIIGDMKRHGIELLPVDVNASGTRFHKENHAIRAGLIVIKHVGAGLAKAVVRERRQSGAFRDPLDFYRRIRRYAGASKAFPALAMSGAFDSIAQGVSRKALVESSDKLARTAERAAADDGSQELFGEKPEARPAAYLDLIDTKIPPASAEEIIEMEMESTDLFLTRHPIEKYWEDLPRFDYDKIAEISTQQNVYAVIIGYVYRFRQILTRDGQEMLFATVSDLTGSMDIVVFPRIYRRYRSVLKNQAVYLLKGVVRNNRLIVEETFLFDHLLGQSFPR